MFFLPCLLPRVNGNGRQENNDTRVHLYESYETNTSIFYYIIFEHPVALMYSSVIYLRL
jgi:hypothetical protein